MLLNSMPDGSNPTEQYVTLLTQNQARLYAYILSLMGSREQALDVLQETNLVLWRKADDFELNTNFIAWAFSVARFKVLAHRQRLSRNRMVFDDELLDLIANEISDETDDFAERQDHLNHCLKELRENQRALIHQRYAESEAIKTIAQQTGKTPNAVTKTFHRIHVALMRCIQLRQASRTGS